MPSFSLPILSYLAFPVIAFLNGSDVGCVLALATQQPKSLTSPSNVSTAHVRPAATPSARN